MKITEIRGYHLDYVMAEPVRNSVGAMANRSNLLVELVTDSGLSGWGETLRSASAAWAMIEADLGHCVLGHGAAERLPLWHEMTRQRTGSEPAMLAVSALDMALWDLQGKIDSKPVSELLGGRLRGRVRAYLSGPFMKPGDDPYRDLLAEVDQQRAYGFTAFKVRAGLSPRTDGAMIDRLRQHVGPDVDLMLDLNTGYPLPVAQAAIARCEDAGLLWIEEPLDPADIAGYERLAGSSRTPLAAGENLSSLAQFAALLQRRAVGIIQPDLSMCGGFTGAVKVAGLAEAFATPVVPHIFGTAVNFFASLQFAAVLPGYRIGDGREYPYVEFERLDNPLRTLAGEASLNADGTITVPDLPGIGLELSRHQLEPYTRQAWVIR